MNFFEMLVMSRKLSFFDGKVSLYGQEISIYPARSMMESLSHEDPELMKILYSTAKESMLEYRSELMKSYDSSKVAAWIISTINLYGLGKVQYVDLNAPIGEMSVENSPFVQYLKDKVDKPVDNILRGIIAGMVSAILGNDYDAIELECMATGGTKCRFLIDKKEKLIARFPEICKTQID